MKGKKCPSCNKITMLLVSKCPHCEAPMVLKKEGITSKQITIGILAIVTLSLGVLGTVALQKKTKESSDGHIESKTSSSPTLSNSSDFQTKTDKQCQESVECLSDKFLTRAEEACRPVIKKDKTVNSKWDLGEQETIFNSVRWKSKVNYVLRYTGDRIKFEHFLYSWERYEYTCDYDTRTQSVLGVSTKLIKKE